MCIWYNSFVLIFWQVLFETVWSYCQIFFVNFLNAFWIYFVEVLIFILFLNGLLWIFCMPSELTLSTFRINFLELLSKLFALLEHFELTFWIYLVGLLHLHFYQIKDMKTSFHTSPVHTFSTSSITSQTNRKSFWKITLFHKKNNLLALWMIAFV